MLRKTSKEKDEKEVDLQNEQGYTALHVAIDYDNYDLIETLFSGGVDVNAADELGNTALHRLCHLNRENAILYVNKLLERTDIEINKVNLAGETALDIAVKHNKLEITKVLLKNKAEVNAVTKKGNNGEKFTHKKNNRSFSALYYAFCKETLNNDMIDLLLFNGAQLNECNDVGVSVQELFLSHPKINELTEETLQGLIAKIDVSLESSTKKSVLHLAALHPNISIDYFKTLALVSNKQANVYDKDQLTPLHICVSKNNIERVKVLVDVPGIDLSLVNNNQETPLLLAIILNYSEIALFLLSKLENLKKETQEKLIYHVASHGSEELLKALIAKNADVRGNKAAIQIAWQNNHSGIVVLLLAYGVSANCSVDKEGNTLAHGAISAHDASLLESVVNLEPSIINKQNNHGETPAHLTLRRLTPTLARVIGQSKEKVQHVLDYPNSDLTLKNGEKPKISTWQIMAATGFASQESVQNFFTDPNFKLTEKQLALKEKLKENPAVQPQVSIQKEVVTSPRVYRGKSFFDKMFKGKEDKKEDNQEKISLKK